MLAISASDLLPSLEIWNLDTWLEDGKTEGFPVLSYTLDVSRSMQYYDLTVSITESRYSFPIPCKSCSVSLLYTCAICHVGSETLQTYVERRLAESKKRNQFNAVPCGATESEARYAVLNLAPRQ